MDEAELAALFIAGGIGIGVFTVILIELARREVGGAITMEVVAGVFLVLVGIAWMFVAFFAAALSASCENCEKTPGFFGPPNLAQWATAAIGAALLYGVARWMGVKKYTRAFWGVLAAEVAWSLWVIQLVNLV